MDAPGPVRRRGQQLTGVPHRSRTPRSNLADRSHPGRLGWKPRRALEPRTCKADTLRRVGEPGGAENVGLRVRRVDRADRPRRRLPALSACIWHNWLNGNAGDLSAAAVQKPGRRLASGRQRRERSWLGCEGFAASLPAARALPSAGRAHEPAGYADGASVGVGWDERRRAVSTAEGRPVAHVVARTVRCVRR
jgi:hypothetical protein